MAQSVNSAASLPAIGRFPDPPIGRPMIISEPEPYHDAGSVPPTGPPGFDGEWNPIDGGTPPGTTPGVAPGPGTLPGPASDKLRLMLAIARALGPAVADGGMAGGVDSQTLADALRGLANLLDPPRTHGLSPIDHGPYGPTAPIHRYPGDIGGTYPGPGGSGNTALFARRNG